MIPKMKTQNKAQYAGETNTKNRHSLGPILIEQKNETRIPKRISNGGGWGTAGVCLSTSYSVIVDRAAT